MKKKRTVGRKCDSRCARNKVGEGLSRYRALGLTALVWGGILLINAPAVLLATIGGVAAGVGTALFLF